MCQRQSELLRAFQRLQRVPRHRSQSRPPQRRNRRLLRVPARALLPRSKKSKKDKKKDEKKDKKKDKKDDETPAERRARERLEAQEAKEKLKILKEKERNAQAILGKISGLKSNLMLMLNKPHADQLPSMLLDPAKDQLAQVIGWNLPSLSPFPGGTL